MCAAESPTGKKLFHALEAEKKKEKDKEIEKAKKACKTFVEANPKCPVDCDKIASTSS